MSRGLELRCDKCRGGGVDMSPRPIDAWPTLCYPCKGHGGLTAREISDVIGISEGVVRKVLQGKWKPRTIRQLARVLDALIAERSGHVP